MLFKLFAQKVQDPVGDLRIFQSAFPIKHDDSDCQASEPFTEIR